MKKKYLESHKEGSYCKLHTRTKLTEHSFHVDCFCGGETEYKCHICEREGEKELKRTCHWVRIITAETMLPIGIDASGALVSKPEYRRFPHNGKKIKKGSYATLNNKGFLVRSKKQTSMIVVVL